MTGTCAYVATPEWESSHWWRLMLLANSLPHQGSLIIHNSVKVLSECAFCPELHHTYTALYPALNKYPPQDISNHDWRCRTWIIPGHISFRAPWFKMVSKILGQSLASSAATWSSISSNTGKCFQSSWPCTTLVQLQWLEIHIWLAQLENGWIMFTMAHPDFQVT